MIRLIPCFGGHLPLDLNLELTRPDDIHENLRVQIDDFEYREGLQRLVQKEDGESKCHLK